MVKIYNNKGKMWGTTMLINLKKLIESNSNNESKLLKLITS